MLGINRGVECGGSTFWRAQRVCGDEGHTVCTHHRVHVTDSSSNTV